MKIDNALINRLATLSKLDFDADEKQAIQKDLQNIIGFFEQISELDTDNVEPLIYMSDEYNVFRADTINPLVTKTQALRNAPVHDGDFIKVPKVINK